MLSGWQRHAASASTAADADWTSTTTAAAPNGRFPAAAAATTGRSAQQRLDEQCTHGTRSDEFQQWSAASNDVQQQYVTNADATAAAERSRSDD